MRNLKNYGLFNITKSHGWLFNVFPNTKPNYTNEILFWYMIYILLKRCQFLKKQEIIFFKFQINSDMFLVVEIVIYQTQLRDLRNKKKINSKKKVKKMLMSQKQKTNWRSKTTRLPLKSKYVIFFFEFKKFKKNLVKSKRKHLILKKSSTKKKINFAFFFKTNKYFYKKASKNKNKCRQKKKTRNVIYKIKFTKKKKNKAHKKRFWLPKGKMYAKTYLVKKWKRQKPRKFFFLKKQKKKQNLQRLLWTTSFPRFFRFYSSTKLKKVKLFQSVSTKKNWIGKWVLLVNLLTKKLRARKKPTVNKKRRWRKKKRIKQKNKKSWKKMKTMGLRLRMSLFNKKVLNTKIIQKIYALPTGQILFFTNSTPNIYFNKYLVNKSNACPLIRIDNAKWKTTNSFFKRKNKYLDLQKRLFLWKKTHFFFNKKRNYTLSKKKPLFKHALRSLYWFLIRAYSRRNKQLKITSKSFVWNKTEKRALKKLRKFNKTALATRVFNKQNYKFTYFYLITKISNHIKKLCFFQLKKNCNVKMHYGLLYNNKVKKKIIKLKQNKKRVLKKIKNLSWKFYSLFPYTIYNNVSLAMNFIVQSIQAKQRHHAYENRALKTSTKKKLKRISKIKKTLNYFYKKLELSKRKQGPILYTYKDLFLEFKPKNLTFFMFRLKGKVNSNRRKKIFIVKYNFFKVGMYSRSYALVQNKYYFLPIRAKIGAFGLHFFGGFKQNK